MNHALKNQTSWKVHSPSEIIDISRQLIATQRNESIRVSYDFGEMKPLPPYSRYGRLPIISLNPKIFLNLSLVHVYGLLKHKKRETTLIQTIIAIPCRL